MAKIIFKYRINTIMMAVSLMAVFFLPPAINAQPQELERISEAQSAEELIQIYSGSDNAITRRRAVQKLSLLAKRAEVTKGTKESAMTQTASLPAMASVYELLDLGLEDPKSSVIKETIYQIGYLRLGAYNEILVEMYHTAESRFLGRKREVQYAIIQSLGKTGGGEARVLFRQILGSGEVNYRTNRVLYAIRDMQDASLLEAVTAYAETVENLMMAMSNTPETRPRYAMYMQSLQLARSVQKLISEK